MTTMEKMQAIRLSLIERRTRLVEAAKPDAEPSYLIRDLGPCQDAIDLLTRMMESEKASPEQQEIRAARRQEPRQRRQVVRSGFMK